MTQTVSQDAVTVEITKRVIICAMLYQTMIIQCARRTVVTQLVASQQTTVTTKETCAMGMLAQLVLNAQPGAASMASAQAIIQTAWWVKHVKTTLVIEGVVTMVVVTKRTISALITIPDASPTQLIHQAKVVVPMTIAVAPTLFGSGSCSR